MSTVGFQLASPTRGGFIPLTVEKALAAGYAEAEGALVVSDADGNWAACGADPISIGGVALTPGGTDTSGYNILGHKEFPPGYMQAISPANGVRFIAPYVGDLPAATGASYGVIRDSDGVWKVDFNEVVNQAVQYLGVVDKRPDQTAASEGLVVVTFLAAVVQLN